MVHFFIQITSFLLDNGSIRAFSDIKKKYIYRLLRRVNLKEVNDVSMEIPGLIDLGEVHNKSTLIPASLHAHIRRFFFKVCKFEYLSNYTHARKMNTIFFIDIQEQN